MRFQRALCERVHALRNAHSERINSPASSPATCRRCLSKATSPTSASPSPCAATHRHLHEKPNSNRRTLRPGLFNKRFSAGLRRSLRSLARRRENATSLGSPGVRAPSPAARCSKGATAMELGDRLRMEVGTRSAVARSTARGFNQERAGGRSAVARATRYPKGPQIEGETGQKPARLPDAPESRGGHQQSARPSPWYQTTGERQQPTGRDRQLSQRCWFTTTRASTRNTALGRACLPQPFTLGLPNYNWIAAAVIIWGAILLASIGSGRVGGSFFQLLGVARSGAEVCITRQDRVWDLGRVSRGLWTPLPRPFTRGAGYLMRRASGIST
jgi:hypothetical protein